MELKLFKTINRTVITASVLVSAFLLTGCVERDVPIWFYLYYVTVGSERHTTNPRKAWKQWTGNRPPSEIKYQKNENIKFVSNRKTINPKNQVFSSVFHCRACS